MAKFKQTGSVETDAAWYEHSIIAINFRLIIAFI